jgi:branched-chain amino acid aminotransferase
MINYININNKIVTAKKASILAQDRGFRFGDGVFETCLIKGGIVYNFAAHITRLNGSLEAIRITFDTQNIISSCYRLIVKNNIQNGYLRIAISRGVGSVGYLPIKNIKPTLVIETLKNNSKPKLPIKLFISSIEKPSSKSIPTKYKLAQGLNSILAKMEAIDNNCFDALILNNKQQICETSSANIFWIKNNILYTPHQDSGCLQGTIRGKVIALSPIKVQLTKTKLDGLLNADEIFITNVAIGVLAIDKIGNQNYSNQNYSKIIAKLLKKDINNYVKKAKMV